MPRGIHHLESGSSSVATLQTYGVPSPTTQGISRGEKVRALGLILTALLLPVAAAASTLRADESLTVSETPAGNAYLAGSHVDVVAPVVGDLIALGTRITVGAPIDGDVLALAGSIVLNAPVTGDVRIAAPQVLLTEPIDGEVAAFGATVRLLASAREVRAAGMTVEVAGASGPVTVYGSRVTLSGEYEDDVRVVAADHITLAPGTVINGTFEYNAPEEAIIPDTATVVGGTHYIGSASFLPTAEEARTFALAGFGIFFVVRVIAALVTAGLLAGLFPAFTRRIAHETVAAAPRHLMFLLILGFTVMVLTPVVCLLLLVSVVGIGIALLIGSAYLFLLFLAYLYAAVIAGAGLDTLIRKRNDVSWHHAVVGMLVLFLIGLVPGIGFLIMLILVSLALGAMLHIFFQFAFPKTDFNV